MWMSICNGAVYFVGMPYLYNDIFLTDITGHDRLKCRPS